MEPSNSWKSQVTLPTAAIIGYCWILKYSAKCVVLTPQPVYRFGLELIGTTQGYIYRDMGVQSACLNKNDISILERNRTNTLAVSMNVIQTTETTSIYYHTNCLLLACCIAWSAYNCSQCRFTYDFIWYFKNRLSLSANRRYVVRHFDRNSKWARSMNTPVTWLSESIRLRVSLIYWRTLIQAYDNRFITLICVKTIFIKHTIKIFVIDTPNHLKLMSIWPIILIKN